MAKGNSSSCFGVAIVLVLVFGFVGAAGVLFLYKGARSDALTHDIEAMHATHSASGEPSALIFQRDDLPRFPFPTKGEPISREQFVAHMIEDGATDLAKEAFREAVSESSVSWLIRTQNISERNGSIHGQFDLPWEIHSQNSMQGSSINVHCEFNEDSRANLLNLRRDDWVIVVGKLSFDGSSPIIQDARLANDPLQAEEE